MNIYRPGTTVGISPGTPTVRGTVLSVTIHHNERVSYRCSWWDGRSRHIGEFESSELSGASYEDTKTIGFHASKEIGSP